MDGRRQQWIWIALGGGALLAVLLLAPFLLTGLTCPGMGGMMGSSGMGGIMGQSGPMGPMMGFGWLMLLFWLLVVTGVILLVTWAVRRLASQEDGAGAEAPLAILQRRYARGEIGREEYERIRGDLLSDGDAR